jgi:very-short-patch-repair endonuclease
MKTDCGVSSNQRARARTMRRAPTDAELRLWRLLRDRRLSGFKFRRQVPVGPYIVDFLCVASKLIVEVDGSQHAENIRDEGRDAYLLREGWRVLRFWNHEVTQNREGVLGTILPHAASLRERTLIRPASPTAFSSGESGRYDDVPNAPAAPGACTPFPLGGPARGEGRARSLQPHHHRVRRPLRVDH